MQEVIPNNHDASDSSQELDLHRWLKRLLHSGAKMAGVSIIIVRIALLISVLCLLAGLYIICWQRGYHWFWGTFFGVAATIPVAVLGYYHWILSSLKEAPEQLKNLQEVITRFRNEHPEETKQVLSHKLSSIGKWRTYRLIGRVLKDIFAGASITGNIKTLTAMGNPVFWFSLVVAILFSLLFSGGVILAMILIAVF